MSFSLPFLFLIAFCLQAFAPEYPPAVTINYTDETGTHLGQAFVSKWVGLNVPVNGDSVIPIQAFKLEYQDLHGKHRTAFTTNAFLDEYARVAKYFSDKRNESLLVRRSTGGYSAGSYASPYLDLTKRATGEIATNVGAQVKFGDFDRLEGVSQNDPVLDPATGAFKAVTYFKPMRLVSWDGETPQFRGVPGRFEFPDLAQVGLNGQRFLLDFGKHPFNKEKQLLYPVYVDHFVGENAVLIAPHEVQKLKRAREGERVKVAYWVVPKSILRVAPQGETGDKLLLETGTQFVDDLGEIEQRQLPIETIIRANRHDADHLVEVAAGGSFRDTLHNLNRSIDAHMPPCKDVFRVSDGGKT